MPLKGASLHENGVKEKLKGRVSTGVGRESVSQGADGGGLKKWILPDPSSSFKTTARAPPLSSAAILCPEDAGSAVVDPWVRRCRIASIVGGTILGLGLIAMLVVVAAVVD